MRPRRTLSTLLVAACIALAGCAAKPQTYEAACSKPLPDWMTEAEGIGHLRDVQPVRLSSDGKVWWGRDEISDADLRAYLLKDRRLIPQPQLVLEVSPQAQCRRVAAVRALIDATGYCNGEIRNCSEGQNWQQWPILGGP